MDFCQMSERNNPLGVVWRQWTKENRTRGEGQLNEPTPKPLIRRAELSDINELTNLYMELTFASRKLFHPFPFKRRKLQIIFLIMILSGSLLTLLRRTIPRLGFLLLVAEDYTYHRLIGFTYLSTQYKDENGHLVANRGIVAREGIRSKGIGTALDSELIMRAKQLGVDRFSVTALKDNSGSIALHKKMGYQIKGQTQDRWNNEVEDAFILELELG
jgi:L-amino acid N-acyltransferase YncA